MLVNPFWFGFLIAMVVVLVLVILLAFIKARQDERALQTQLQIYQIHQEYIQMCVHRTP